MTKGVSISLLPQLLGDLLGQVWTEIPVEIAVIHPDHWLLVDKNVAGT